MDRDCLDKIEEKIDKKVDWEKLYWVIGILIAVLTSVFGYFSNSISKVEGKVEMQQGSINNIQTSLTKIETKIDILLPKSPMEQVKK